MAMFIDKLLNSDGEIKVKNIKKKKKKTKPVSSGHVVLSTCCYRIVQFKRSFI